MPSNPTTRDQPMLAILRALAALKIHLDSAPDDWHASMQRAVDAGCVMKLEIVLLAGWHADAKLALCRTDRTESRFIWTTEGQPS